jgi:hypothetical protein
MSLDLLVLAGSAQLLGELLRHTSLQVSACRGLLTAAGLRWWAATERISAGTDVTAR